jgi:lipoyl(octanoyl) transferase
MIPLQHVNVLARACLTWEKPSAMGARTDISIEKLHRNAPVRVEMADGLTDYPAAVARMEHEVALIADGHTSELLWLVEHPPLYTAGTSAKSEDLLTPDKFPVFETGRGGQYTYHGPGQRVAYVMLDLRQRGQDVRAFVAGLETVIIDTLAVFGITGETREDRVGIWVRHATGEDKIAAIGIRVRKGVTFHGLAINFSPDLSHFEGIVPCGVSEHGITSFAKLNNKATLIDLDVALVRAFCAVFGSATK